MIPPARAPKERKRDALNRLERPRRDVVKRLIAREWALDASQLDNIYLGINSFTWVLADTRSRFVVKWVFPMGPYPDQFVAGLELADKLDGRRIRTGPPVRTRHGEHAIRLRGGWLALLRFEDGRPLDLRNGSDVEAWGRTLASCHTGLAEWSGPTPRDPWPWSLLHVEDDLHDQYPWLRATIAPVIARAEQWVDAHPRTMHWLHGDPNPQEFLRGRPSQPLAVLDWGGCVWGPPMYDLGCAMFFAGGATPRFQRFLRAYSEVITLQEYEMEGIPVFWRLRWAMQALHFARRISHGIALGGDRMRRTRSWYDGYNEYGLRVARQTLDG
jgi:Ser/Thr protein kinase RdoA (MazF antagonist)